MTATLVPVTERIRVGGVRVLRRRVPAPRLRFSDGSSVKSVRPGRVEVVEEQLPGGDRVAVAVTVLLVLDVDVAELDFAQAKACGYRTVEGLRAAWLAEHRRAPLARLVRFALGDLRDVPRLVSAGWPDYTSDASRAMPGEPEAISAEDLAWYGSYSWQEHAARRARLAGGLAGRPAAERLAEIQRRRGRR